MTEFKKCTYCAMDIPKEAKICPHCRKKMPIPGGVALFVIIAATIIIVMAISSAPKTSSRTPAPDSDPATATYQQVFREYEICMNASKELLANDKQRGQEKATRCFMKLQTYGQEKAKKAFMEYHEHYGL